MEQHDSLGTVSVQVNMTFSSHVTTVFIVDRDAYRQCGLSRHPWRDRFRH
jgi:hypothetical protein